MWISDVAINTCKRLRSASFNASATFCTSFSLARAKPQIVVPLTSRAIVCTASKSPGDAAGKPASITSMPRRTRPFAISIFSGVCKDTPGVCSPSRRVVSKKYTRFCSIIATFSILIKHNTLLYLSIVKVCNIANVDTIYNQ